MRLKRLLGATLIVFAIFSCDNKSSVFNWPNESNLILNDTLEIAYQDTFFNADEKIWITFDSLLSDSRCPLNVVCVWEGNAEVSFVLYSEGEEAEFTLNTYSGFTNDTTIFAYDISLIDVFPYPHIDSVYTMDDYSVQIIITQ